MYAKLQWHTEGRRAFLIEPDGSTYCEIVTLEGACPPATVAQELTHAVHAGVGLLDAIKNLMAHPHIAAYLPYAPHDKVMRAALEAIAKAEGVSHA